MLTELVVRNFTLVRSLEIELNPGMTAITGETGAGKSILLNALGLCLGDRADYGQIRQGETRAEVSASFNISNSAEAKEFLQDQSLDENGQCLLRRVINANGTSKAWINGQPVTLNTLRNLAQRMISIHSQHEHQRLTRKDQQLTILDAYANHPALLKDTYAHFKEWESARDRLQDLEENQSQIQERLDLLQFQTAELNELTLQPGEYDSLERERHQLANAEEILRSLHALSELVSDNDEFNLLNTSGQAVQIAQGIEAPSDALSEATELLSSTQIQLTEARDSIRRAQDAISLDPARLEEVDARISRAFELARKHRRSPQELPEVLDGLQSELDELTASGTNHEELAARVADLSKTYSAAASALYKSRHAAAKTLTKQVNGYFEELSMSGAELKIALSEGPPSARGGIDIEFLIRTNPGAPHQPIARIASGGELSRISLAIQVTTAKTNTNQTMVFDEVDVGIGGATAAVVGKLLRELGDYSQVICITHLAQVASQAHTQIGVAKQSDDNQTETSLTTLEPEARVREVARMIGGAEVTEQSLAHAESLLQSAG